MTEFVAVRVLEFRKMAKQIREFPVKGTSILSSMFLNSIATRYLIWPGLNRVPQNLWAQAIKRCPSVVFAVENSNAFTSIFNANM